MKDSICNKINTNLINKIKKCFLLSLSVFLILPLYVSTVNAEDKFGGYARGYSDWSTIPTGNLGEVSAIQYGVLKPKTWSSWSLDPFTGQILPTEPADGHWYVNESIKASGYNGYHFEKCEDHGSNVYPNEGKSWGDSGGKTVWEKNLGEEKYIKKIYIDLDTCTETWSNYYTPKIDIYIDGAYVTSGGGWSGDVPNITCTINRKGTNVKVTMHDGGGDGRNKTFFYKDTSKISTEKIEYSHVIEWEEPTDDCWCFTPYPLQDGAGSQIPVERIVYSYPYPPVIGLKTNYYFVKRPTSIETVMGNAIATDIVDGVITPTIHFDKIIYQSGETVTDRTAMLNTSKEQDFELYCSVVNSNGIPATAHKTYHIYDLVTPGLTDPETVNPEEYVNVDIYDRFISEKYKDTLQGNSLWETDSNYKNLLNDVLSRETGEEYDID